MIVAIQGDIGSFSECAVRAELGQGAAILSCPTFDDLFSAVTDGLADVGMVPVHNSIAGPVFDNASRVLSAGFRVIRRIPFPVRQCLIVRPGTPIDAVRLVASHPIALAQCARFLGARPTITTVATGDTAGGVRHLMDGSLKVDAVIASTSAAEIYGAQVLVHGIEDDPQNTTEFCMIASHP